VIDMDRLTSPQMCWVLFCARTRLLVWRGREVEARERPAGELLSETERDAGLPSPRPRESPSASPPSPIIGDRSISVQIHPVISSRSSRAWDRSWQGGGGGAEGIGPAGHDGDGCSGKGGTVVGRYGEAEGTKRQQDGQFKHPGREGAGVHPF
jgi:hypothetical protein